jgi:hypothetical protein
MFQISLRQLFTLVTAIALAIVSLNYASAAWEAIVFSLASIVFLAAAIVAIVGRASDRAFAVGLVVVMAGYGGLRLIEMARNSTILPTAYALVYLQDTSTSYRFYNKNGEEVASPTQAQRTSGSTFQRKVPLLSHFLPIGHCWSALLFGYLGGHFARFVYVRQDKASPEAAA